MSQPRSQPRRRHHVLEHPQAAAEGTLLGSAGITISHETPTRIDTALGITHA